MSKYECCELYRFLVRSFPLDLQQPLALYVNFVIDFHPLEISWHVLFCRIFLPVSAFGNIAYNVILCTVQTFFQQRLSESCCGVQWTKRH